MNGPCVRHFSTPYSIVPSWTNSKPTSWLASDLINRAHQTPSDSFVHRQPTDNGPVRPRPEYLISFKSDAHWCPHEKHQALSQSPENRLLLGRSRPRHLVSFMPNAHAHQHKGIKQGVSPLSSADTSVLTYQISTETSKNMQPPTPVIQARHDDHKFRITDLTIRIPNSSRSATGLQPDPSRSRWRSREFMVYYVAFAVVVPMMIWTPIRLSSCMSRLRDWGC
jgi:hypothetical protein